MKSVRSYNDFEEVARIDYEDIPDGMELEQFEEWMGRLLNRCFGYHLVLNCDPEEDRDYMVLEYVGDE